MSNIDLSSLSEQELGELKDRIQEEENTRKAKDIQPLQQPDFRSLVRQAKGLLEDLIEDPDYEHDHQGTYEALMTAIYGKDIFQKLDKLR